MDTDRDRNDRPTAGSGRRAAASIAFLYVVAAGIWIVVSGNVLEFVVEDPETQHRLETVKGLLFVAATGGLLYALLRGWHRFAVDRARLKAAFTGAVDLAMKLVGMRDPYTAGHERRGAHIAVAIGREMGLDDDRLEGVRVAAELHDVGNVKVPLDILVKPSRLSAVEFEFIKTHAEAGHDILKGIEFPWPVGEVALQHHERWNGSGYPQGLKGDAVRLEARIVGVADVVEAMASHRPYRPALGVDEALAEIENGRGTLFDPDVVDVCLRLFRDKGYAIPD